MVDRQTDTAENKVNRYNYIGGGSFVCPGDMVKVAVWTWRPSFLELYVTVKFPQLLKLTALCVQGDINADMLALTTLHHKNS